jgi:hypothetical protein
LVLLQEVTAAKDNVVRAAFSAGNFLLEYFVLAARDGGAVAEGGQKKMGQVC